MRGGFRFLQEDDNGYIAPSFVLEHDFGLSQHEPSLALDVPVVFIDIRHENALDFLLVLDQLLNCLLCHEALPGVIDLY